MKKVSDVHRALLTYHHADAYWAMDAGNYLAGWCRTSNQRFIIDLLIAEQGQALLRETERNLADCSHLLLVASEQTCTRWTLPFLKQAAEAVGKPFACYLPSGASVFARLDGWPVLHDLGGLRTFTSN